MQNTIAAEIAANFTEGGRVQERRTGRQGTLRNAPGAEVAIVKWDDLPEVTWAEWSDLA
ncbi:hypothetical protein SEA_SYRA333_93 [Mycobacterium phage Syra333]|uniref:Uncharacterized protein n=1 Tax=Mycobacterium phage Krueger TaxID=2015820 RepID=A0A222ZMR8_9CAUD|nr:hypothetical protein I5G80_gp052 [Mycobacterium phage Krueger]ASR85395.1 hypothetical protein SEA_PHRANK_97 [Mycobacterium phage Phrank]UTN93286.1 hypothetical protein SEA_SUNFLOWER1121_94 [Mycobacterium Phage Sunflower1121]WNM67572.1 hypothetical protein SEA_SHADOW1_94 [Mycobacterium phage Shadow1]WNM69605.1 hypothetical protein SEA_SYRA333_93 [Mycobacterium phage Syra333]ASR85592.1 hypothetical protein SEA_KRUEGER_94 [Mycobacterium phage Krueger]